MHGLLLVTLIAVVGYFTTMTTSLGDLALQLSLTESPRRRRISSAHAAAVVVMVAVALAIASVLSAVPTEVTIVLAFAPLAHAVRSAREPASDAPRSRRSLTTLSATLAHGGGSLAVWIVLLRASWILDDVLVGFVLIVCELAGGFVALKLANSSSRSARARRIAHRIAPYGYALATALVVMVAVTAS